MEVIVDLVERIRSNLNWLSKGNHPTPSQGAGGQLPFNWVLDTLISLLSSYPSGVTLNITLGELQRRWAEANHAWGRNMDGKAVRLSLIKENHVVPVTGILEVCVESVRRISDGGVVASLADFHEQRIEWYVPPLLARLLVAQDHPIISRGCLLRITGLRTLRGSSSRERRLLPSDLFAAVIGTQEAAEQFVAESRSTRRLMRVTGIGRSEYSGWGLSSKRVYLSCVSGSQRTWELLLSDSQAALCQLVKRRDLVVLEETSGEQQSAEGGELRLQEGALLYVCPEDPSSSSTQTQHSAQHSEPEVQSRGDPGLDLERFRDRVMVAQVTQRHSGDYINFCMLLAVRKLRDNCPTVASDGSRKHERFGATLADETGQFLVTFWDSCGAQAASLRPGQLLYIRQMYKKTSSGKPYFSVSPARHATFVTVSSVDGLLCSPLLYSLSSPVGVRHVTLTRLHSVLLGQAHLLCGRPVPPGSTRCSRCAASITPGDACALSFLSAQVELDDGREALLVTLEDPRLLGRLLGVTPRHYAEQSAHSQQEMLRSLLGSHLTALFLDRRLLGNFVPLNVLSACRALSDTLDATKVK